MKVDARDEKWGWNWFFGAGLFAVALSLGLAYMDHRLIHSDKEKRLGETLHELRSAQTSLAGHSADPRQLRIVSVAELEAMSESSDTHH